MAFESFVPVTGTIMNIARGDGCCSQTLALRTENGTVHFMVDAQTFIVDARQMRTGMRVAAFYDANLPVPLIFPPQYRAQLITTLGRNEQVMLSRFNRNLVSADRSLQLNIANRTVVQSANGQRYDCSLANQELLVYYTASTRSIPAQTTPERVIVFCW